MFLPPGAGSKWVLLKKIHWSWAGDAGIFAQNPVTWGLFSRADPPAGAATDETEPPH